MSKYQQYLVNYYAKAKVMLQWLLNIHIITILLTVFLFSGVNAQVIDSQLVIINNTAAYHSFTKNYPQKKLVRLASSIQPLYTNIVYATTHNFTGKVLYQNPELYLVAEAVTALAKVQDSLKHRGLSLLFFDGYRPYAVTQAMWKIVPDERYAANPAKGSGHNRGIAVDLTLADLKTGKPLLMPTPFDSFSDTAHHDFMQLPAEVLANRLLLKLIMEFAGFKPLSTEWWHYSLPEPKRYPLLNIDFKELKNMLNQH